MFEHVCIQELRYELQWRRYDFPGSDHFILLCENPSNPPEVLSCYKRFICYAPPAKLVTGSTFHAFFFNDVPGELWLQHQKSVLANLCICPPCHIPMVSLVSLPESRKQCKYKAENWLWRKETWQVQHWWKENHRKARGEVAESGRGKSG